MDSRDNFPETIDGVPVTPGMHATARDGRMVRVLAVYMDEPESFDTRIEYPSGEENCVYADIELLSVST